jgi:hypothetical protein
VDLSLSVQETIEALRHREFTVFGLQLCDGYHLSANGSFMLHV